MKSQVHFKTWNSLDDKLFLQWEPFKQLFTAVDCIINLKLKTTLCMRFIEQKNDSSGLIARCDTL